MKNEQIIKSAIAGVLALGLAASATQVLAAKGDNEKCGGIVKAGKNDCGTSTNACAGQVNMDNDAEAWIYLPKGVCERIAGGQVVDGKPNNKPGGAKG
ncbi:MAG: DUF2282 domain-containing protein [Rhodocyclaceae bacterium]|nr:DUF2282 domain-containing protein [Rhodocyclaceae bacterium]